MAYEIEDWIDEAMHHLTKDDSNSGFISKIIFRLNRMRTQNRMANQINEVKTRVVEMSHRHKRYKLDASISTSDYTAIDPRLCALYADAEALVGMDGPRDEITKWFMGADQQLMVVSVLGIGGLGKTALANEVYKKIGGQFDCHAFISISQKPDIMCPPQNNHASRVITTTRIEKVAMECCSYRCEFIYKMKPLNEHDSRRLFFNRIFGSENACPERFKGVSTGILQRCGGLPLAIVSVSSLLANPATSVDRQWEYVSNSLSDKFGIMPALDGMRNILHLSYKNLPYHLKTCFLYLGIYPEDYIIRKSDVVRQWITEGFVHKAQVQDAEDVAGSYFNELVNRSMILPTDIDYQNNVVSLFSDAVHQMSLDLTGIRQLFQLRYVKIEANIHVQIQLPAQIQELKLLESIDIEWGSVCIPPDIVHLPHLIHLVIPEGTGLPDGIGNLKSLITLRSFDLGENSLHNIRSIRELTNLKDLNLCYSGKNVVSNMETWIDVLRSSLEKLSNLKYLHLYWPGTCENGLCSLNPPSRHLQRLEMAYWWFSKVPKWIGGLHELHVLKLAVKEVSDDDITLLAQLPSLTNLGLRMRGAPKQKIIIYKKAFPVLRYFKFWCSTPCLVFEASVMSEELRN
ncbi:Os10g0324100 [Oryza sativa Japonica Group]|uniref:Os10g0324100 protein n=2 Tax=Oryza sativa subsp. japonica TaxID=39947 RepID=C7J7F2_ORYSJ|nr:NB-ARC domain containing protein, expressed [Oryza sativa Japonica Group]BAH94807.1 Os10g0324100 [Oryza sativa Japonica Group]|eukprot:NP_001176079.1 Os10g0324100 [Oryza sativa Japonica Group]